MSFRLREDAIKWFSELDRKEPTSSLFDLYYLCLMAGLASGRSRDTDNSDVQSREIVKHFIAPYRPAQRLLIGLLVVAEARRGGINLREKAAVRKIFSRLVTQKSTTQLTEEGMRCMNAYASGGYDFLEESRTMKPVSAQEFLRDFVQLMDKAVEAGSAYAKDLDWST